MLYLCPTCHGRGARARAQALSPQMQGDEVTEQDCQTCDGAGHVEKPPR